VRSGAPAVAKARRTTKKEPANEAVKGGEVSP
jgi:hypothetical protein